MLSSLVLNAEAQTPIVNMLKVEDITSHKAHFYGKLVSIGTWTVNKAGFMLAPVSEVNKGDTIMYSVDMTRASEYDFYTNDIRYYMKPDTKYWIRAWVSKGAGSNTEYCYSDTLQFRTLKPVCTYMTALDTVSVAITSATLYGSIDSLGDAEGVVGCGFIYSLYPDPYVEDSVTVRIKVENTVHESMFPFGFKADISGLLADKTYYFKVWTANRYNNNYIDTCFSEQMFFKTNHSCSNIPLDLDTVSVSYNDVELTWTPNNGQTRFEVEYGVAGHERGKENAVIIDTPYVKLTGLNSNRTYTASVRAVCDGAYSEWCNIKSFRTLQAPCESINGLHLEDVTYFNAKILWTPGIVSQYQWDVLFAKQQEEYGFAYTVYSPEFIPLGLSPNTGYKVKVRANCGEEVSEWSEELNFSTAKSSDSPIDSLLDKIVLYPNPTSGMLYLKNIHDDVIKIEIYSSLGTLIYASDSPVSEIDLSHYASGNYVVNIYRGEYIQIETLIIK